MGLIIPTPDEVNALFRASLSSDLFGNPGIASRTETLAILHEVRAWASTNSVTAQAILSVVTNAEQDVYLVGMKGGGYTCFCSDDPAPGKGVVYFNFDARFEIKQEGKANAPLHNYIAFLHEMGHAKQWIETPEFFNGSLQNKPDFAKDIKTAAQNMAMRTGNCSFGDAGRSLKLQNLRLTKPLWSVRIETDNLMRHEWPMCDESGHVRRAYTDLVML